MNSLTRRYGNQGHQPRQQSAHAMLDDPQMRDNYHFWFFTYPSSYPFPYSAARLRHDLDKFDEACPEHNQSSS